jgi:hypothetical protein
VRKAGINQRSNQNPSIEERQTTQRSKEKEEKDKQWWTTIVSVIINLFTICWFTVHLSIFQHNIMAQNVNHKSSSLNKIL